MFPQHRRPYLPQTTSDRPNGTGSTEDWRSPKNGGRSFGWNVALEAMGKRVVKNSSFDMQGGPPASYM